LLHNLASWFVVQKVLSWLPPRKLRLPVKKMHRLHAMRLLVSRLLMNSVLESNLPGSTLPVFKLTNFRLLWIKVCSPVLNLRVNPV
jgi:hypothetical protein